MPQKWVNAIPFGSAHTLGTLNHGLESLSFYWFITLFGLKSSLVPLVPPGAPWRLPGPPGAPLTPGMSSWAIVSHPGSLWVIFDPSGVSNWGVSLLCIAVQCSAMLCFFCVFWAFLHLYVWFGLISSYLGPLNTENITWIQDGVIWFRPTSCTHFATFQHICYTPKFYPRPPKNYTDVSAVSVTFRNSAFGTSPSTRSPTWTSFRSGWHSLRWWAGLPATIAARRTETIWVGRALIGPWKAKLASVRCLWRISAGESQIYRFSLHKLGARNNARISVRRCKTEKWPLWQPWRNPRRCLAEWMRS